MVSNIIRMKPTTGVWTVLRTTLYIIGVLAIAIPLSAQRTDSDISRAIELFNDGQDYHENGEYRRAIELYTQALELIPEFPEAVLQLGNAYRSIGNADAAETAYRRAVVLRDDWTLAKSSLGALLVTRERYSEAEPLLAEALKLDQQNFQAWASLAELRLKTAAPQEIRQHLLDEISHLTLRTRTHPTLWTAKAALEFSLGDLQAAVASSERALDIEPQNRTAQLLLVDIKITEGDHTAAEDYLDRFDMQSPNSSSTLLLRARILLLKDQIEEAVGLLESVESPSLEIVSMLAKLKFAISTDAADLEKKLDGGENPVILGRLCSLYRAEKPALALEYCRRAVKAEPHNIGHAIGIGAALVQAKRYDDAVSHLRKLEVTAPNNAAIRANLALALFQARRYAEAKPEFRTLLDRQPDRVTAYYFLAICHDNLGELMDAMANYQEFLRRADRNEYREEIERVTLRLPTLDRQINQRKK